MKKILIAILILSAISCENLVDDINQNPNEPVDVPAELLLKGMMLADITVQVSHMQRISAMWSGQYKGLTLLYGSLYTYNITSEEANDTWEAIYVGVLNQGRVIRESLPDDGLMQGITKVLEAHVVGTATSIFGSVPYSEVVSDIANPAFDTQSSVYQQLQSILDEAIINLESVPATVSNTQDIFYGGTPEKWIEAAYTLKARYYLQTKNYADAYAAAQNGISSGDNSMKFYPPGVVGNGDSNLLYSFAEARGGYMTSIGTYFESLLDPENADSRNNAKTNEEARANFFYYDGTDGAGEIGVGAQTTPQPLILFEENLLILAEAGARTEDFATGLTHLNELRAYLNSGASFNMANTGGTLLYESYDEADFENGGIENSDGIDKDRALLREIIEERYVSGYGQFIPFNDARRLRKEDADIAIPIPFNTPEITQYPERFIVSQDELNANSNAPDDPGIFSKTEVNQ
ncbi:MAG: SusD/RagB family nutrient-binding outer membrane lipoprotein [Thalassobius sp.]|nr:SusD/RagB family nutrient-binding outer membrane lipoprotein [Thalassovita sp.]